MAIKADMPGEPFEDESTFTTNQDEPNQGLRTVLNLIDRPILPILLQFSGVDAVPRAILRYVVFRDEM